MTTHSSLSIGCHAPYLIALGQDTHVAHRLLGLRCAKAQLHVNLAGSYDFDKEEDYPSLTISFVDQALDEVRPYLITIEGIVESSGC